MTITELLNSKDTEDAKKLAGIAKLVQEARKGYGNTEATITMPEITTVNGELSLSMLQDDSKLAVISQRVDCIRMEAFELNKVQEGINIEKCVEALIATDPILVNIHKKESFGIL